MFTFKPAPKSTSNGNGNPKSNGVNGNSHGINPTKHGVNSNGQVDGGAPVAAEIAQSSNPNPNGAGSNGHSNGNHAPARAQGIASWLGLGNNGNGHAAHRPAAPRLSNHHGHKHDSVIGAGLNFQGTLTGAGNLRIDGTFDGTIDIQGALLITDGAKVTAEVRAGAVSVGGSLKGNVTAGKVEILSTGRVWGDLLTTAFATEEGAFLRGQVRMEDEVPPAPAPQPTPDPVPLKTTNPATVGI